MRRQVPSLAVQAAHGPGRPSGGHRGGDGARIGVHNRTSSLRRKIPIAVVKCTFGNEGRLKCQTSGGLSGANLKHRARDAMEKADLRTAWLRAEMRASGPPSLRRGIARCFGPWVLRDPWRSARPRTFPGERSFQMMARPGPCRARAERRRRAQKTGAMNRVCTPYPSPERGGSGAKAPGVGLSRDTPPPGSP